MVTGEETSRAISLKERIIERLQEHTPDTLGNLEHVLNDGLRMIKMEKEKLAILAKPLP